ncbi:MAG: DUF3866 family protein [Janthinobacterium lividum]
MLTQAAGKVLAVTEWDQDAQELSVRIEMETRRAVNYVALTGPASVGDEVLLNTTAQVLKLGTGGFDFVSANLSRSLPKPNTLEMGHIIKGRYLPSQIAVLTLEEQEQYAEVWERDLEGLTVLIGQLHSQIGPAAAGLFLAGKRKVAYIMTDAAALPIAFSHLVRDLKAADFIQATITCGQAFGGDYETVTLHSALLAAKHILECDAAIVCQGPGNAGTGTKYGFSGIEQAQNLDIVKALGGKSVAIVRMSSSDKRPRHLGISHHTRTTLDLAYSRCLVPLPAGTGDTALPPGHIVQFVPNAQSALDLLAEAGVKVTSMGRTPAEDPAFFLAAAAAGLASTDIDEAV